VKAKTYLNCPWFTICGRKSHKSRGRVLCRRCREFVTGYAASREFKTQCGVGDERYLAVKAERVKVYAERAKHKLPLFAA
jgi:hypothetical protein